MTLRALVALLAALALAGCGGTQIGADEVSGAPPELTVPDAEAAPALEEGGSESSSGSGRDSDTTSTGTDETTTGESGGSEGTGGASSGGDATATPAPQATAAPAPTQAPAAPQDDTSPPAGSGAERFEDFCQQNPGAC